MSGNTSSRKASAAYSIVTALLVLAVIGGLAQIGTRAYRALSETSTLEVPATIASEELAISGLPEQVAVPDVVPIQVSVTDPSVGQLAMALLMDIGPWLLAIAGLLLLRALAGSIRAGDPFGAANVSRLRKLGFLLVGLPVVEIVSSFLLGGILDTASVPGTVGWATTLNLVGPIAGLGVLVLAEVFAQGVRLREDVEGTV